MSVSTLNGTTRAFGLSLAITSLVSALLVVLKELNEGVLTLMKGLTIHHWVTHSIFDVAVFVVLGLVLSKANNGRGVDIGDSALRNAVVAGFLLGCAIVAAFYLHDTLK